eukprot:scaffold134454_cov20-Tisochrysis_lutea.AAC.1
MREWQAIRQQPQHCTTPFVTYARCPVYSKFQQNFKIWKQWDIFRAGYVTVERLSKEAQRTAIVATKNLLWASFDYYSTLLTGVQTCTPNAHLCYPNHRGGEQQANTCTLRQRPSLLAHIGHVGMYTVRAGIGDAPVVGCWYACRHSEATPILVRPKHVVTHTGRAGVCVTYLWWDAGMLAGTLRPCLAGPTHRARFLAGQNTHSEPATVKHPEHRANNHPALHGCTS